jgi:nickel-dependent lactate racemase
VGRDGDLTVDLAYGRGRLTVALPEDRTTVLRPRHGVAVPDGGAAAREALRSPVAGPPLRDRVRRGARVAISVCDLTRPQPRRPVVTAILDELAGLVRDEDVTVLVASGTHRGNTPAEHRSMFGEELLRRVEVVNHDAREDASLVWCGRLGADVPVWLNRRWVEADVRITTGFVEPHFFAGFSGGPKMVAPGLAGLETVLVLHDAARIGSARATWGVCDGNPVHDDVRAIAAATGVDFTLDVVLDAQQRITAAFGGDLFPVHAAARELVRSTAMHSVPGEFDVVVTSNSGFPLDQNLYQAVKGISAAAAVVRPGGLIVCAAECADGLPEHGSFRSELGRAATPQGLLDGIAARSRTVPDQWQVQVLARVLGKARVAVHADGLSPADVRLAQAAPVDDVAEAVRAELAGLDRGARICVLPEGPQTIPYVASPHRT